MKAGVKGDFELPPEGITIGRCYRVIDLGTQESKYKDKTNYNRQILVVFELPKCTMEIENDAGEKEVKPMSISKRYNLTFGQRASLRKDMESWYGKKFNDKDIQQSGGFDPEKIIGKAGQIQIQHNESYANVINLLPLAEGQECPEQINPTLFFDLDAPDQDTWNKLSEGMQTWIAKSPEGAQFISKTSPGTTHEAPPDDGFDDIPF